MNDSKTTEGLTMIRVDDFLNDTPIVQYQTTLQTAIGNEDEDVYPTVMKSAKKYDRSCHADFIPSPEVKKTPVNKSLFKRFMDWKPFAFLEYFFRSMAFKEKIEEQDRQIEFLLLERSNILRQNSSYRNKILKLEKKIKSAKNDENKPNENSKSQVILEDILRNWGDPDLQHWISLRHGENHTTSSGAKNNL